MSDTWSLKECTPSPLVILLALPELVHHFSQSFLCTVCLGSMLAQYYHIVTQQATLVTWQFPCNRLAEKKQYINWLDTDIKLIILKAQQQDQWHWNVNWVPRFELQSSSDSVQCILCNWDLLYPSKMVPVLPNFQLHFSLHSPFRNLGIVTCSLVLVTKIFHIHKFLQYIFVSHKNTYNIQYNTILSTRASTMLLIFGFNNINLRF